MTDKKKSIAVIWDRLGAYHIARLNELSRHARVTVIEMSEKDTTYQWSHAPSGSDFRRLTLFSDKPWNLHPPAEVASRVEGALSSIAPELVAVPGWEAPASLTALQWCLDSATPSVLMSDSQFHDMKRSWWKEALKRRIVPLHNAGFVGGETHAEYLVRLGMAKERISMGYNVVDNAYFKSRARSAREKGPELRNQLKLPTRYFLTSCRFVEKKNLVRLLTAYAGCCRALGDAAWGLVLVGEGIMKRQLQELAHELGVQDRVVFTGFQQYSELPAYYALASVFVLPSTGEQWGLVVNEAMACGLPVLVSEVCGCAGSLVRDGVNGFTFDPLDTEALSGLLIRLNQVPDLTAMGLKSEEIVRAYGPQCFAENLMLAARNAEKFPRRRPTLLDRALIRFLVRR
jgi:glycosyltransferase involved in cell wall biosynthesis